VLDYNDTPIKFKIHTRSWDPDAEDFISAPLTASLATDGKTMRLSGTASSTVRDLHGDEITESGLVDMETAANQNLTIFGNHEYKVPEDVFGSVEAAVLARAVAQTKTGDPVHDLRMSIIINSENERAVKTWKAINKGTKLGLSIGAMIPEGGAKVDKKTKRLIIEHLELLETSIVAIPANPRSWVDSARKSYFEAPKVIEADLGDVTTFLTTTNSTSSNIGWVAPTTTTVDEFVTQGIDGLTVDDTPEPTPESDVDPEPEPTVVEKDIEPTDDETPAAPQSEPTAEDVTNSASETVALAQETVVGMDAEVTAAFGMLGDLVERLTTELTSEREAKKTAEQQRDAAMTGAAEAIAKVTGIVSKLAELPLGPRAAVVRDAAKSDLSQFEDIYSREFLELLRSK
jgi:hypothetical protein